MNNFDSSGENINQISNERIIIFEQTNDISKQKFKDEN
jgi:hypothetical protein